MSGIISIVIIKHIEIWCFIHYNFRYTNVRVGTASASDGGPDAQVMREITPHQCRLRDITYSAPIMVDLEYTSGHEILTKKDFVIGRLFCFTSFYLVINNLS
jgi:DNA-directed RNA polymerase beta subunit